MHHIAIMNKSWQLIPKILCGQKIIESRWYQTRRTPWNRIHAGDKVCFKNSGEAVTAQANVSKVLQFELQTKHDVQKILDHYGKQICLVNSNIDSWGTLPKYCILIFLSSSKQIAKPFQINKTGFGNAAAWLTLPNINSIKLMSKQVTDGAKCTVIAGTHKGKAGVVQDIHTSKTGHITITVLQNNGDRFKTLAKNVTVL